MNLSGSLAVSKSQVCVRGTQTFKSSKPYVTVLSSLLMMTSSPSAAWVTLRNWRASARFAFVAPKSVVSAGDSVVLVVESEVGWIIDLARSSACCFLSARRCLLLRGVGSGVIGMSWMLMSCDVCIMLYCCVFV